MKKFACAALAAFLTASAWAAISLTAPNGDDHALNIFRNPALPEPHAQSWAVATYFNRHGAYYSDAWMVISGRHEETPDANGYYRIKHPSNDNFMLGIWGDIIGPSLQLRSCGEPGAYPLSILDGKTGRETLRITDDGTVLARSIEATDGWTGEVHVGAVRLIVRGGLIREVVRVNDERSY